MKRDYVIACGLNKVTLEQVKGNSLDLKNDTVFIDGQEVVSESLGYNTGLSDVQGIEIFSNSLVRCSHSRWNLILGNRVVPSENEYHRYYSVEYFPKQARYRLRNGSIWFYLNKNVIETGNIICVGNAYLKKELLLLGKCFVKKKRGDKFAS